MYIVIVIANIVANVISTLFLRMQTLNISPTLLATNAESVSALSGAKHGWLLCHIAKGAIA